MMDDNYIICSNYFIMYMSDNYAVYFKFIQCSVSIISQ